MVFKYCRIDIVCSNFSFKQYQYLNKSKRTILLFITNLFRLLSCFYIEISLSQDNVWRLKIMLLFVKKRSKA
jgi:hypothetical protein